MDPIVPNRRKRVERGRMFLQKRYWRLISGVLWDLVPKVGWKTVVNKG